MARGLRVRRVFRRRAHGRERGSGEGGPRRRRRRSRSEESRPKTRRDKGFPSSYGLPLSSSFGSFSGKNGEQAVDKLGGIENRFEEHQTFSGIFVFGEAQEREADFGVAGETF